MANKAPLKTTFEPENTFQPIYTGGSVALDQGGQILATTLGEDALLTDLNTGRQLARIEGVSRVLEYLPHSGTMKLTAAKGWRAHLNADMYVLSIPLSFPTDTE